MQPASRQQAQSLKAIVENITSASEDIKIIRLRPVKPFSWLAGQHINIGFGGLAPRPYSIANAPGGNVIEIHIKRGKGDASRYVMDDLAKGEEVVFSGPEGQKVYRGDIEGPILALAGGLGIAPIRAIAEAAFSGGFAHPFTLYWSTSDAGEKYLSDYFEQLAAAHENFTFHPVTGRLTEIIKTLGDLSDCQIYVSGPPAMIAASIPLLREKGAQAGKIGYDRHPEADAPKP